jgi:hypothetical protein
MSTLWRYGITLQIETLFDRFTARTCGKSGLGPQEETPMHETHRKAAEHHELAAQSHRTAAEHNEKGDYTAEMWHLERALKYSDQAYKLAKEAHTKSGQMESS